MNKPLIVCVVGTRPDCIKTAPVVLELQKRVPKCDVRIVSTGQHREMVDQMFSTFGISAETHLALLKPDQSLAEFAARVITGLDQAKRMPQDWLDGFPGRVIVFTSHRRENWGEPMASAARATSRLIKAFPGTALIMPMNQNPTVRKVLYSILGSHDRIHLIDPPEYPQFEKLVQRATLILSDSGGVQEEAPAFGAPVLVLRLTTEGPEGIMSDFAELVGTDEVQVFERAAELLRDTNAYSKMGRAVIPYRDGRASGRIADLISVKQRTMAASPG